MSARRRKPAARPAPEPPAASDGHPLSPAFLALLPMFACYEFAVHDLGGMRRNAAEVLLGLWLAPFGDLADGLRVGLLLAFAVVALHLCRAQGVRVRDAAARMWLEAGVAALTLGPALVLLTALALRWNGRVEVAWDASREAPGLGQAALVFGGAVYEEFVFRIGLYGLLYWTLVRALRMLGATGRPGVWLADSAALSGSALCFAGFHFRRFTHWLWDGGAPFSWPVFLWLTFAGLLLGVLYRWRGPGVAAGAHGLFNLGLLVGIDPEVLA
jgi:hypothetical protein